jgi:hypothetical protein
VLYSPGVLDTSFSSARSPGLKPRIRYKKGKLTSKIIDKRLIARQTKPSPKSVIIRIIEL